MTEIEEVASFLDELEAMLDIIEERIEEAECARATEFARASDFIQRRAEEVDAIQIAMQEAFATAHDHIQNLHEAGQSLMDATSALGRDVEASVDKSVVALQSMADSATEWSDSAVKQFNESLGHLEHASQGLEIEVAKFHASNQQDLQRMTEDGTATEQGFDQLRQELQVQLTYMEQGISDGHEHVVRASADVARAATRAQAEELAALTQKAEGSLAALRGGVDQGMVVLGQIRAAGTTLSSAVSGDARATMQQISNVMSLIGQIRPVLELAKTLT